MAQKKKTNGRAAQPAKKQTNAKTKPMRGGTSAPHPNMPPNSGKDKTRQPANRPAAKTRRAPSRQEMRLNLQQKVLILGVATVFVALLIVLSLLSPNQGELTSALSGLMWRTFGWGGVFVPLVTGAVGLYLVLWGMEQAPCLPVRRLVGAALLFVVFEAFASLVMLLRDNGLTDVWQIAAAQVGGGYVGGLVTYVLTAALGNLGTIATLVIVGAVAGVLASGITRADVSALLQGLAAARQQATPPLPPATPPIERPILLNPARQSETAVQRALPLNPPIMPPEPEAPPETAPEAPASAPRKAKENGRAQPRPARPQLPSTAVPPAQIPTPIFLGRPADNAPNSTPPAADSMGESWKLPLIADILEAGTDQELNSSSIREQVEIIEHTLESFGAPATVVEINQGPTITQFGVEPNFVEMRGGKRTKVKVGKIASLADDLALALAAQSIRVQAPVPGKGYVGIEVPNVSKAMVSLRDVMESAEFQKIAQKSPLAIGLGQNVSGQPIAADLAAMPHLLIAGTTGSGKSVCVNSIIAGLLLMNTPDVLKLVMIDPKRVELTGYNGIPHLAAPVVVEMDRVIGTLQWALREMDHRYKLFAEMGARNITEYNKKITRESGKEKLAYIVIIIDELADLMMLAPEDTERAITRLAQMARATGIHVVIATQRPSVDVVTGLIKANFPARIAFAVASSTDSRVILDTTGAERLLGQGDMLFQSPDAAAPVRLQGTFVSDAELAKLIGYWRTARRFNYIPAQESATSRGARRDEPPAPTPLPPMLRVTPPTAPAAEARSATPSPAEPPAEAPPVQEAATPLPTVPPPQVNLRPRPAPVEERQRPLWEELQALEENPPGDYEDELLPEAITAVRKMKKASTSLLQRHFRIGYTRAARLIDMMEEQGVIGPPTGTSKAREVLPWEDSDPTPQESD